MKQVNEILKIDVHLYATARFTNYIEWCRYISYYHFLPIEKLIKNETLYNWYCTEWVHMVEYPFKKRVNPYITANIEAPIDYWEVFNTYPEEIKKYYPKTLLNMIKREFKMFKKLEKLKN